MENRSDNLSLTLDFRPLVNKELFEGGSYVPLLSGQYRDSYGLPTSTFSKPPVTGSSFIDCRDFRWAYELASRHLLC